MNPVRILSTAAALGLFLPSLFAQNPVIGGGRAVPPGFHVQLYGGVGELDSLDGELRETRDGALLSGGLSADLSDLGLADDTSSMFLGVRLYNPWVTFLVDYRSTSLEASGRADQEIRLDVEPVAFQGLEFDYLLIPVDSEYDIDAETEWLGLGIWITPFTLFPESRVRFTPWVHLGIQIISMDYDIDAGGTVDLANFGLPDRVYAERGRASGSEDAGIPEYGFGGQLRILLNDRGLELVGEATYKVLDFQGAIDSLGVDGEEFEDIDFEYEALEVNVYLEIPLNKSLDLLAGIYLEQVDVTATLEAEDRFGGYDRELDLGYTLYGFRVGLQF
jgi:hypothetical protein